MARMALAAMDSSESVEMPLDYLQGHKDGLEWAARLAEANHPDTGDWLYDDPIELAKAIRKGPDMPPAQPVADSEPDRNPVLAYADSYRDMAKQGVESVPIWSVITDLERNIAPLYRHAQPAPERDRVRCEHAEWSQATFGNVGPIGPLKHLSKEALEAAAEPGDLSEWADIQFLLWDAQRRAGIADEQITQAMIEKLAVNKQREWPEPKDGEPRLHIKAQPAPVVPEEKPIPNILSMYAVDAVAAIAEVKGWNACRAAMLAAAPQLPGSEPATVPGKWIPVSERIPDNTEPVLCIEKRADFGTCGQPFVCWHDGGGWVGKTNYRPIVTHWMPLPADPQEVKGE
nr:dATP/dGTP pyrophosphohydrolase domain-containing protein [Klebsiella quasipneumoniae]